MFLASQYIFKNFKVFKTADESSIYSIILGATLYATIYLYLVYYNPEHLETFNKFIIYIIGIDLLLSALYYYTSQNSTKSVIKKDKFLETKLQEELQEESEEESQESEDSEEESENESLEPLKTTLSTNELVTPKVIDTAEESELNEIGSQDFTETLSASGD